MTAHDRSLELDVLATVVAKRRASHQVIVNSSIPDPTVVTHISAGSDHNMILIEAQAFNSRVIFLDDLLTDDMFKLPTNHRHLLPYGLWPPPQTVVEHRALCGQLDALLQSPATEHHHVLHDIERPLFAIASWIAVCNAVLHFREAQSLLAGPSGLF